MICNLCGRAFKNEQGLRVHRGWKHPLAAVRPSGLYGVRVDCAWCGKKLGVRPLPAAGGVSHGICETCLARVRPRP